MTLMTSSVRGGVLLLASCVALMSTACSKESEQNLDPTIALQPDKAELTFTVGDSVFITVLAKDDDGDPLTFEYQANTDNELSTVETAQWFVSDQTASFNWTPDSADVTGDSPLELIFIVKDNKGGYADRKVLVNIVPGNGSPQFESSANELYKNCCEKPLSFEVKIRDDDSTMVDLRMNDAPPGAEFTQVDGKRGQFTWKPSESQAERRVHGATFVADDGQNPPVEQKVTIIIPPKNLGGTGADPTDPEADICAGEETITHTPLGPQREVLNEFPVEAQITGEAAGRYDEFVIFWSQYDPVSNLDSLVYSEQMTLDSGTNTLTGAIPNQALREDMNQTIFYKICMIDIDAAEDDPTSLLCTPTATDFYYSFNVYLNSDDMCTDDTLDYQSVGNDDFQSALAIPKGGWDAYKLCAASPDYHSIRVRPGAKIGAFITYPIGADVTITDYDGAMQELDGVLDVSDCTNLVVAEFEAPASGDGEDFYIKLEGDEVAYHIRAVELESGGDCKDTDLEPNDLAENATPLTTGERVSNLEICPTGEDIDLFSIDLDAGQKLDLNMVFADAGSNLMDMTLFAPHQRDEISTSSTGVAYTFAFNEPEEPLSYEARHCGTHYLMVFSPDGSTIGSYELEAAISEGTCKDEDEFASACNHDLGNASLFAWNETYSLEVCGGGEDWLRHIGVSSEILAEVAVTSGDVADVTFEVYDGEGNKLASGEDDGDGRLFLSYTFPDDEMYYFRVASDSDVSYDLTVIQ